MANSKTIFIIINRGILVRNFLRTAFLILLAKNKNLRIIILIPEKKGVKPPAELMASFASDNVSIEIIENKNIRRWERLFNQFGLARLVFAKGTKFYLKFHIKSDRRHTGPAYWLTWLIFTPLSRLRWLKRLTRKIDLIFFRKNEYKKYFAKYQPDLIFSTSVISHLDADILKEAKRRGLKTVAMPRSWDNLDKFLVRVEPDLLLVQNEGLKKEAIIYQGFEPSKIKVVGFPQFDMYRDKDVILTKEEYCRRKNFNSKLPIIFLGSEGLWSEGDADIFGKIIQARDRGVIPDCNVLIRPHFSKVHTNDYSALANCKNVYIDNKYRESDFFHDNWDPSYDDMVDFTNSLYHCQMMITFASTLALDAVCFNKPIIAIKYGARFINGEDKTHIMYETGHYHWVLETKAVSIVGDNEELLAKIRQYFSEPRYKETERKVMLSKLCYKVDGQASQRIVEAIKELLNN